MARSAALPLSVALVALLALHAAVCLAGPVKPKNLIFMIADGFSPSSETFVRTASGNHRLPLDKYFKGMVQTYSAETYITDSAAAATAYSCGHKSYNAAIAVTNQPAPKACGSFMEAAKAQGYRTGLVVTSRITHATPAAFSSHVSDRDEEYDIAQQQAVNQTLDVLFGGGLEKYTDRPDGVNLLQVMEQRGYQVLTSYKDFEGRLRTPVIGLFAKSHMDYEIDRVREQPPKQPSLVEMTRKALALLSGDASFAPGIMHTSAATSGPSDAGFVLMIEGSRIDMSAHEHDAASHYYEITEYQKAVALVEEFVAKHPDTLVISTSDHGTGGISTGRELRGFNYPPYTWYPEYLFGCNASCDKISKMLKNGSDIATTIRTYTGIQPTDVQIESVKAALATTNTRTNWVAGAVGNIVAEAALIGFTTPGHVGVDVSLYAFGSHSDQVRQALYDNTEVAAFVINLFNFDVVSITNKLSYLTFPPGPPSDVAEYHG